MNIRKLFKKGFPRKKDERPPLDLTIEQDERHFDLEEERRDAHRAALRSRIPPPKH